LWDFLLDVAQNLNHKKASYRFSNNTKSFVQAMKNYFVPGKYESIFRAVVDIYLVAKEVHGINGLVPVILAKDKIFVK
jgi:hypothetical protein